MKYIILLSIALLGACSVINEVGQYAKDNPIVVDAATRQAVFRYIDAAETEAGKAARAQDIIQRVRRVDARIEGNPSANVETLMSVISSEVEWDGLSIPDRMLVQDILTLVRLNLENKQREGMLHPDALVGIRAILQTAVSTAMLL